MLCGMDGDDVEAGVSSRRWRRRRRRRRRGEEGQESAGLIINLPNARWVCGLIKCMDMYEYRAVVLLLPGDRPSSS